jgi:hypothetical protein
MGRTDNIEIGSSLLFRIRLKFCYLFNKIYQSRRIRDTGLKNAEFYFCFFKIKKYTQKMLVKMLAHFELFRFVLHPFSGFSNSLYRLGVPFPRYVD